MDVNTYMKTKYLVMPLLIICTAAACDSARKRHHDDGMGEICKFAGCNENFHWEVPMAVMTMIRDEDIAA